MDPHHEAAPESGADVAAPDIAALYEQHKDAMYGVARKMLRRDDQHRRGPGCRAVRVEKPAHERRELGGTLFVQAVKRKIYDLWKSAAHQHEHLVLDDATPLEDELGGAGDCR